MSDNAVQKKPGFFARVKRFFLDIKGEVKKVVWPDKKQIVNHSVIVVVVVAISALIVGGLDILVSTLLKLFVGQL